MFIAKRSPFGRDWEMWRSEAEEGVSSYRLSKLQIAENYFLGWESLASSHTSEKGNFGIWWVSSSWIMGRLFATSQKQIWTKKLSLFPLWIKVSTYWLESNCQLACNIVQAFSNWRGRQSLWQRLVGEMRLLSPRHITKKYQMESNVRYYTLSSLDHMNWYELVWSIGEINSQQLWISLVYMFYNTMWCRYCQRAGRCQFKVCISSSDWNEISSHINANFKRYCYQKTGCWLSFEL